MAEGAALGDRAVTLLRGGRERVGVTLGPSLGVWLSWDTCPASVSPWPL